jgi:ubiquitin-conjugating enzyme E2 J2
MANLQITPLCFKRLKNDLKILRKHPLKYIHTYPDELNILTWYFLIIGPSLYHNGDGKETECPYGNGHYIGKIMHNPYYPLKPPDFIMLTPSGRFLINKKICMTNTGYHEVDWSAAWTIKAILQGFLSIMLDDVDSGISHIKNNFDDRKIMAAASINFNIKQYPKIYNEFSEFLKRHYNKDVESSNTKNVKKTKIYNEIMCNINDWHPQNMLLMLGVSKFNDSSNIDSKYQNLMKITKLHNIY